MNTPPTGPSSVALAARADQWTTLSWLRTIGEIAVNVLLLLAITKPGKESGKTA
ncbi:hypothetical protein [Bacillus gobiensis]